MISATAQRAFYAVVGELKHFSSGSGETDVFFFELVELQLETMYIYIYIYSTKIQSSEKVLTVSLSPFFDDI